MRIWGIALLLAAGCSSSPPPDTTTTGRPLAERVDDLDIKRFARVHFDLYRGGQPPDYEKVRSMGIKTVVNLRKNHGYRDDVLAAGMGYLHIPLRADISSTPPTDAQLKQFFKVVLESINQPVLVHCADGKDRTGVMIAIYRIEVDGWSNAEAMEEMDAFDFSHYYKDFERFVNEYKRRGYAR